jgi:threonine dehydrogenase-like Zn-dependent dehydrogenase
MSIRNFNDKIFGLSLEEGMIKVGRWANEHKHAAAAVLKNNVVVGSVNANKRHWYKARKRLGRLDRAWLSRLITRREKPENFKQALERKPDDIKVVIQFSEIKR